MGDVLSYWQMWKTSHNEPMLEEMCNGVGPTIII